MPLVLALVMGLVAGACGSSAATPVPTSAAATATATPTDAATATLEATAVPTPTPAPTTAPTPTAAPTAASTATLTATPAGSSSASPSATPLPSAACTGGASTKQWLADQMPHFKFKLYCAVMPSGWSLVGMSADYDPCSGSWPESFGTQAFGPLSGTLTGDSGSEAWSNVVTTSSPTIRYVITGNWFDLAAFKAISAAMHPLS
jgi:hypothetical protein